MAPAAIVIARLGIETRKRGLEDITAGELLTAGTR